MSRRWYYGSHNQPGNLHEVAAWLTEFHPEWDVVAMHYVGSLTVIVYRLEIGR
jgi:hypothetical protein